MQRYTNPTNQSTPLRRTAPTRGLKAVPSCLKKPLRWQKSLRLSATMLLVLLVAMLTGACSGSKPTAETADQALKQIEDSLRAFNIAWTRAAIARELASEATAANPDRRASLLADDMTCLYYQAQADSTLLLAREITDYCHSMPDTHLRRRLLQRSLRAAGAVYTQYHSQPDSAILYQRRALEAVESDSIAELLVGYNNLADAYKYAGDLVRSVETYRQALHVADSAQVDSANYIPLYAGLASCYTDLRDFAQSAAWWDRAALLWPLMTQADRSRYLNNRGTDRFYARDYEDSRKYFERLDSLCAPDPDMVWDRLFCHVNLADVYLKLGETDSASRLIDETYDFFSRVQVNEAVMSYLYTQQMDLARQRGDYARVEQLIADHPLPRGLRPDQAVLRLDFLREFFRERGDWRRALEYEDRYNALDDSLRAERVAMKAAELQRRYERDATVLSQRAEISSKESRLMRTYALAAAALAAALLLLGLIMTERYKRRRETKRLHDNIVAMRMDNIRNRVTPHFIYNALNIEMLAREKGKPTQMNKLVGLLRQGQTLAADFCISLAGELDFIKLYLAVESQAVGPIDFRLKVAEGIDLREVMLPSMTIQIFVENSVKHAFRLMAPDAHRRLDIDVDRTRDSHSTCITVSNNGPAVAPTTPRDSTGTGMRVIYQTIQMLNERNRDKIEVANHRRKASDGTMVYTVSFTIPDHFNYDYKS